MDNINLEKRYVQEIRTQGETRSITGTAIVFNSPSVYMGFTEIIDREAITEELINNSDIVFLYNHENSLVPLARSKNGKGTLKINITDDGVDFSFNAKKTPLGDEVLEAVRAGDLDSCSFAFAIEDGGERWDKLPNGEYQRTITKIGLLRDFSVVPFPAYSETTINTRGLDELKAQEELERVQQEELVNTMKKELEEYHERYRSIIKKLQ